MALTKVFDSIPESTLYKLKKKQEETTRSLEKIEKGELQALDQDRAAGQMKDYVLYLC